MKWYSQLNVNAYTVPELIGIHLTMGSFFNCKGKHCLQQTGKRPLLIRIINVLDQAIVSSMVSLNK